VRCFQLAPFARQQHGLLPPQKTLITKTTVLWEFLASVSTTSLYAQLLIFWEFLPIHISLCTGKLEPGCDVLLIGL
jgi:hypothetical protein